MRPDNRLSDAPMTPVTCASCGARVLVRKSSWEQTSVQWNGAAVARCQERPRQGECRVSTSTDGTLLRPAPFLVCPMLRASIEQAASMGSVPVLDEL
ncbi:hypothetical protein BST33_06290 [Mycolicibacter minnesotensis]|uniref:Uncharacterized protein n=1 Tax=Mycolicibacter minnesotensis TaxID=1118379 RepID=A0A7I7R3C3_9MYCO|nr:hypothetical protein [Mycolicibacter minnesotensis]ORB02677.1 hypothetical protein BST33_06290 [Mycolicibacter minnesotensis]BBY32630.1 hypothetical protein MMIN_06910 [Mycolicibacter minnesotensis]